MFNSTKKDMYPISIISYIFKTGFKSKIILVLFVALLALGCNKKKSEGSSIYTAQNYSDLELDEAAVNAYFKAFPESDTIQKEVYKFYKNREYQFAWFNKKGMTAAVPIFHNQIQNYSNDFNNKSLIDSQLDSLIDLTNADNT